MEAFQEFRNSDIENNSRWRELFDAQTATLHTKEKEVLFNVSLSK